MMAGVEFDLQKALGAQPADSLQKIAIYLPNKDNDQNPVPNIEDWISAALQILVDVLGGATRLPTALGRYRVKKQGASRDIVEDTVVVYSYIFNREAFENGIKIIRDFLHGFGEKTNQDAVMVEYLGENPDGGSYTRAYYISQYDKAPAT